MRKRNTESLKDIINQFLKSNHLDKPLNEKRIIDAWPKVLGANISKYTSGLYVKNKVLYVSLTSSVLRQDLFISKEEIKDALNKHAGGEIIKEIIFK